MKKIKSVMEWTTAIVGTVGAVATVVSDRRVHREHGEHLPCDCRSTCLSCLRD